MIEWLSVVVTVIEVVTWLNIVVILITVMAVCFEVGVAEILIFVFVSATAEMSGVLVIKVPLQPVTVIGPTSGLGRCSDRATMEM